MNNYGKVFLAGSGPGDVGLITINAVHALQFCDVILYDNLANPQLLSFCKKDAELIYVGKKAGKHHLSQDRIIELLIKKAKEGKNTIRLKGGDPLVFGRGSEEALAIREEGIEFEFIPGITAGAAASTYAGIPMTHRNLATQSVFITAHETPSKNKNQVEWGHLAKMKHTNLIIYMGATMIPKIVNTLIHFGMEPNQPAAIIENGTMPNQRTLTSELVSIPQKVVEQNFKAPLIFFIGPSVALRKDLQWFESKPLFGKRIVSTRAEDQSETLFRKLSDNGAIVVPFKVIKTKLFDSGVNLKDLFNNTYFDWIIFSSENGVRHFFELLKLQKLDSRIIGKTKIAVIGSGTEKRLNSFYLNADFIPNKFTSDILAKELSENENLEGKNILRVKGDFKKDLLTDDLRKSGAKVQTFEAYKLMIDQPDNDIIDNLIKKGADAYLFTSTSTVSHFFEIIDNTKALKLLNLSKAIAIGPITAAALKSKNVNNIIEAKTHSIDGIIETLKNIF